MEHPGICVGELEVSVVCEGYAPLDLADELPGAEVDWAAEGARHPWAFHDERSWAWHVHAFALRTAGALVLVDTGLGDFPPYRPWAVSTSGDEALAVAGVERDEVSVVVHTHLHADHAGGAVIGGEPRFPNAGHIVHPADWTFFEAADDEEDFAARHAMQVLLERGMLDLAPEDRTVAPGVEVVHSPGHTPGHRSVIVRSGGEGLLLTGDLLHVPPQVANPDLPSTHDEDPELGCRSRAALLAQARREGYAVAVSHFGRPFGRVGDGGWTAERPSR
jgi:glyoxylase-like metal-dependent hydrolase (beta-lactamase superfamily II)